MNKLHHCGVTLDWLPVASVIWSPVSNQGFYEIAASGIRTELNVKISSTNIRHHLKGLSEKASSPWETAFTLHKVIYSLVNIELWVLKGFPRALLAVPCLTVSFHYRPFSPSLLSPPHTSAQETRERHLFQKCSVLKALCRFWMICGSKFSFSPRMHLIAVCLTSSQWGVKGGRVRGRSCFDWTNPSSNDNITTALVA